MRAGRGAPAPPARRWWGVAQAQAVNPPAGPADNLGMTQTPDADLTDLPSGDRLSTADVARLLAVSKRQVRRLATDRGWPRMTAMGGRPHTTYARPDVLAELSARKPALVHPGPSVQALNCPTVQPAAPPELTAALAPISELLAEVRALRQEAQEAAHAHAAARRDWNRQALALLALAAGFCLSGAVLVSHPALARGLVKLLGL